ncbi:hypothetical protein T440DRAFT_473287 [Plenodomus tracheiphilus IPT5]|uniref:ADP-ribose 1''-phosphate phosphatase n=1 Tax=Plenodomus tracheiphilus IPT5 TaxID=1408161 RepID=A0A6A7AR26_9PLEO|nr:hypothetical protein T440DRAFT_473287 [Plenodomus tracheiphilus IPT5]
MFTPTNSQVTHMNQLEARGEGADSDTIRPTDTNTIEGLLTAEAGPVSAPGLESMEPDHGTPTTSDTSSQAAPTADQPTAEDSNTIGVPAGQSTSKSKAELEAALKPAKNALAQKVTELEALPKLVTTVKENATKVTGGTCTHSETEQTDLAEASTGSKRPAPPASPPPTPAKMAALPIVFKSRNPKYLASTDFSKGWLRHKLEATDHFRNFNDLIEVENHSGDMFDAPPRTVLIHACNSIGKWGAGIAVEFKRRYPKAFGVYHGYCKWKWDPRIDPVPTGSALLIPPLDEQGHWIACLFTSSRIGKEKDSSDTIVRNTIQAVQDLLELVETVDREAVHGQQSEIGDLRMCKINSGKFGVEWARTKTAITGKARLPYWRKAIEVWVREGEEDEKEWYTKH